ncbi:epoxyqueuosine reductase QueH [Paludibacter sp.]|uniref:epoxyqueuosine reductase QueH n=1 Tax=Paludibacter sp. TaxID=1898105 RepID=UPI00135227C1|nr:epoxyqueuosine reductase QueH [Paludibacter sp.]MTK53329.1 epoxyqueuosine reductase QueH [Paludibacter sp.]
MQKVLLHTCCAPCSAPIIEWLLNNEYIPTLFFFNPNIYPTEEYLKRKKECIAYAQLHNIDFVDGDYDHERWLQQIVGLEEEPERGTRCLQCFKIRMKATAIVASEMHFSVFTTTLAGSRWKSLSQITEAGIWAASHYKNVDFWDKDWKKAGLTERRKILLQENNFYNQQYCGCEFSIRK